ncbi:S8 family serine peptidase [Paenibacillus glycanilyticus]|uniref:Peptidase S8/S53 domain-containing protein n=1 Tax=Paenibacillus glycanilyticus TaxID=126569 RepID=A0ABQ6GCE8_9BACL|nr:S8 family serine peptidase [Paenibacillus glycanilyticus]GLX67913.1 hypothetical protein MU1_22580 [Paenibacillus glycanilyticus]
MCIEPSWMRLGFTAPPDQVSGQGIGIIIIDDLSPHPAISHLAGCLKYVVVDDDSIICRNIAEQQYDPKLLDHGIHGLMTVLTLAHQPFYSNGLIHTGIASGGNFIVLSHGAFKDGEGERLKRGVDWILANYSHWNIRLILSLGWHAQDDKVLLEETKYNPTVQALEAVTRQGIMVICANGNSDIVTILPPREYFAVGGFNDQGSSDPKRRIPYPGEPYGYNGDGYYRPDIRAPRTRILIPYCEGDADENQHSLYTGTSAASTLIAGACMNLLSRFPNLETSTLRNALVDNGDLLIGDNNIARIINAERAASAISKGITCMPKEEDAFLDQTGLTERAIHLSRKIRNGELTREILWDVSNDPSPLIRKIAVYALKEPASPSERASYWDRFYLEQEDSVRSWFLYGLLQNSDKTELHHWIPLASSPHWTIRWCVSDFLSKFSDLPQLVKTHDPNQVLHYACHVKEWFELQR